MIFHLGKLWNFIIIIIYSLEFFTLALADGLSLAFEWQQISRTILSILAVFNNVIVWMVSTRPQTSKSSSPFSNPLVTVPKAPITIGIIFAFMLHSFSACKSFTLEFEWQQVSSDHQDYSEYSCNLNNALLWMASILPLISNSSSSFSKSLEVVPSAPTTTCITITIMFHIIIFTPFRVFPTSVSRWFFTRFWVTKSLLKSPGLFSVFWPISIMLYFGWSPLVLSLLFPPVIVPIFWWLYQEHQLQLVSPSFSCSTVFSIP